jgi:hypothetical protein
MRNIFIVAGIFLSLLSAAQSDNTITKANNSLLHKISFHSINQLGIVEGEKGTTFQMQTINGLAKNYWFGGIGVGVDYYFKRTVPVFIDIRRNILNKDKSPFIYADAGISFPWEKQNGDDEWYKEEYKKGSFYDLGLGYNLPINDLGAVVFSIGYSEKKLREERYTYNYLIYSGIYDGTTNKNKMDHHFRRISLKVGFRF